LKIMTPLQTNMNELFYDKEIFAALILTDQFWW
jgi:hypothetical protein